MAVNKIQTSGGDVLLDLTGDTVTASDLRAGVTAHNNAGEEIVGTLSRQASAMNFSTNQESGNVPISGQWNLSSVSNGRGIIILCCLPKVVGEVIATCQGVSIDNYAYAAVFSMAYVYSTYYQFRNAGFLVRVNRSTGVFSANDTAIGSYNVPADIVYPSYQSIRVIQGTSGTTARVLLGTDNSYASTAPKVIIPITPYFYVTATAYNNSTNGYGWTYQVMGASNTPTNRILCISRAPNSSAYMTMAARRKNHG